MLKIYGIPISVHTRKVIVTAIHKSLAFEVLPVVPVVPDSLPPDWRELSPTGRIPVLVDGDFHLADSAAICAYLDLMHPQASLYPDPDRVQDYARVLSLEQYAGILFADLVQPLFHETFVNPNLRDKPADSARVGSLLNDVRPSMLSYLDGIARGAFFVGDSLTTADIAVASNLLNYRYLGFELDSRRYPRLAAIFERLLRQPALQQALRKEQAVVESMRLSPDVIVSALA